MGALNLTLRQALLIPYLALTILLGCAVGWLTYASGVEAVDAMITRVSSDIAGRISLNVLNHLRGSEIVLEAVAPEPAFVKQGQAEHNFAFPTTLTAVEERLWKATGLWTDPNNYVYYAPADGRFVGVLRHPNQTVEVRVKQTPTGKREAWLSTGVGQRDVLLRTDEKYLPAERDWYKKALLNGHTVWTNPYTSFTSKQLIITKAKPVFDGTNQLLGVVAADLPLNKLSDFLEKLTVSNNGVAYIVEKNGGMIASSSTRLPALVLKDGKLVQTNLNVADNSLMKESYLKLRDENQEVTLETVTKQFKSTQFGATYVSAVSMVDVAGLDWIVVIAIPRTDLMGKVETNIIYNLLLVGALALAMFALGLYILNWVTNDIRSLNHAALRLSRWEKATPIRVKRKDEIGELARSFYVMEQGLMHDALSGLLNREAIRARLTQRLMAKQAFSVLFLDLNLFKQVNDTYGHDAGDIVLRVSAQRLKASLGENGDVGRLGGDEFVIAFASQGNDAAQQRQHRDAWVAKIDSLIRQPIAISEAVNVEIGTSIGASSYPEDGLDAQTLLKAADDGMYEQKKLRDAALGKPSAAR